MTIIFLRHNKFQKADLEAIVMVYLITLALGYIVIYFVKGSLDSKLGYFILAACWS